MKSIFIISIGLMVSSLGTALFYESGLGSSPMATFSDGLHLLLGISYGAANTLANIALLFVLFFLQRGYIGIGTFLCVFTIGPYINLFTRMIEGLNLDALSLAARLGITVLGTALMGLGLGLYVAVGKGYGALEGIVKLLCERWSFTYSLAKIIQDVILVAVGILLGAVWGLGTLIAMLLTGPVLQLSFKGFARLFAPKKPSQDVYHPRDPRGINTNGTGQSGTERNQMEDRT